MPIIIAQLIRTLASRILQWIASAGAFAVGEAFYEIVWPLIIETLEDMSEKAFAKTWQAVRVVVSPYHGEGTIPQATSFDSLEDWLEGQSDAGTRVLTPLAVLSIALAVAWRSNRLVAFVNWIGHYMAGTSTDVPRVMRKLNSQFSETDASSLLGHVSSELSTMIAPDSVGDLNMLDMDGNGQLFASEASRLELAKRRLAGTFGISRSELELFLTDMDLVQRYVHL